MDKPKIGLVGFGFVGSAIAHGFGLHADIKIYDKYSNYYDPLDIVVNGSDFLFLCLPTPMNADGSQDLSNLKDALGEINSVVLERKIIVIKSTVVPGTTRKLAEEYKNHVFVFNPEFLTERSAKLDFINTSRIILGSNSTLALNNLEKVYRLRFPHTPIFKTSWEGAEVVKYMANVFFSIKISFLNEMYDIAKKIGVSYEELRNMWLADFRIGNSHTDVPGFDGYRGYGGKCFPKDVNAFIKWAESYEFDVDMAKAAEKVNHRVREVKDWEEIKGATSKNDYTETT